MVLNIELMEAKFETITHHPEKHGNSKNLIASNQNFIKQTSAEEGLPQKL